MPARNYLEQPTRGSLKTSNGSAAQKAIKKASSNVTFDNAVAATNPLYTAETTGGGALEMYAGALDSRNDADQVFKRRPSQFKKSSSTGAMYKGKASAKPKDKNDQRTDGDRLLDYLVNLNAKDPDFKNLEKGGWMKMTFDEGFGGKDGADHEYWKLRIKEEEVKHRSKHDTIKKGQSYKRDLETETRIAALAEKGNKLTVAERAEYATLIGERTKVLESATIKDVFRTPDTTVFTHYNDKVRTFFELGGYRAFPEVVSVQVEVREIFAVDVARGTFRVSFIATTRWYDQFFDKSEYFDKEEMYSQTKPYITFDHVDEGDDPDGVPADASNLEDEEKHHGKCLHKPTDPPGVLYHSQRVQCSFRAYNNLRPFPFDVQHLPITMRLWGSSQKGTPDHGRILLPLTMNLKLAHQHLEWHAYHGISYGSKGRLDRQDLTMELCLKRRPMFFVQNVYLILMLLPTMGFFAFAVPADDDGSLVDAYEARCQVTLTLILTSIAYKFYLEGMLPKAPYLSRLDTFIYGSFMFNAAILFANTIVLVVEKHPASSDGGQWLRDFWIQYDGEEDVPFQVTLDRLFFYVLFFFWIMFVLYSWRLALKDYRALGDKNNGGRLRVASDVDAIAVKDTLKRLNRTETWRNGFYHFFYPIKGATNFKSLKRLYPHLERWKALKKQNKKMIVDHRRGLQTVHQRRYDHVIKLRKLEDSKKLVIKPKGTPSAWHCTCEACENRRPRTDDAGPGVEELESLFREAGIELYMVSELRRQFMNYEIDRDDLERVFNKGMGADAVDRMLETIDVKVQHRVKLIAALSAPKQLSTDNKMGERILAMQGSSSYLWLALKDGALGYAGKKEPNLAGMLLKTEDFKQRLTDELNRIINQPNQPHDLGNTANVIMANTVFQSPMLASQYVYSQRKFDAAHETTKGWSLPSQVWLGYLDNLKPTDWEITKQSGNGAIAVDVGTGKMAFGYAEKRFEDAYAVDKETGLQTKDKHGVPVVVSKSIVRAIDLADFELGDHVETFFEDLCTTVEYMDVRTAKYPETAGLELDPEHRKSDFDHLRDASSSIIDELVKVRLYLIHVKDVTLSPTAPIFLFGTSKLRLWVKELEQKHGGRCTELIEGIGQLMEWMLPQRIENTNAIKIVGCGSTDKNASEQEKAFAEFNGVYLDESTTVDGIDVIVWRKMRSTVTIEMHDDVWTMSTEKVRFGKTKARLPNQADVVNKSKAGFLSREPGTATSDSLGQVYVPPSTGWTPCLAAPKTGRPTFDRIQGDSKTAHPIKFEVLPQASEAKAELRAFQLSLEHGKVNEHRAAEIKVINDKLAQNLVGNIAWGNGSMQGAPDGAVTIDAEMGMNVCKKILQKEIVSGGGEIIMKHNEKKNKDEADAFAFTDVATARKVVEKARRKTMAKLRTLAPRMPTPDPQSLAPLPSDWDASKLTFPAIQKPKAAKPDSGAKKEAAAAATGGKHRDSNVSGFGFDAADDTAPARTAGSFGQKDLEI